MSQHTADSPWYRRTKAVFLIAFPYCHLCHHYIPPGTGQIDHKEPTSLRPDLAMDVTNWRAAHGIAGCPECPPNPSRDKRRRGQPTRCNQAKGNRATAPIPTGRTW